MRVSVGARYWIPLVAACVAPGLTPVVAYADSPRPIDKATLANGPDGTPISAEDIKELDGMQESIGRFEAAQKDYRGTVAHIVKQEYDNKRRELTGKFDEKVNAIEKEERSRRNDAIALFERFLAKYPSDKRWTPDVIFRLAELYFEKISEDELSASSTPSKDGTPPPPADYTKVIDLYKRLIVEFPQYRLIDGAYYLLGFCLGDKMGKELEARQSFLALVCSNQYRPLDPPAPLAPSKGHAATTAFVDPYTTCKPVKNDSRFNPEAWTRIGEYHFDYNELELAISAYARVLQYKDSPYFDKALYKLAWSYYRADRYPEAIKRFDELVVFSDKQKAVSGKEGSDLRAESVQYLGISFAEKDWNGDGIDDPETGLQRAEAFYKGREAEPHVREIFQKLGDIYFDETEYPKAIEVYKRALQKWPFASDNPKVQDRIVLCLERMRNFDAALKEREALARNFGKGTDWYKKNRDNSEAIQTANDLAEAALIKYAVSHHKGAIELKKLAQASHPPDQVKLAAAVAEYTLAADGYARYLDQYQQSKNAYEYTFSYAEALFYSGKFAEAAVQYEKVRDSNLDNRYQEDAAFDVVKAYELLLDGQVKAGKLTYPGLPALGKVTVPVTPIQIPEDVKKLQGAYDEYAKRVPNSARLATMSYKAAETDFRYLHWDDARPRLEAILKKYCSDAVAVQAGKAILTSYTIENNLDKIVEWTDTLDKGKCGGADASVTVAASERKKLKDDARFKICERYLDQKDYEKAGPCYIDVVNGDPKNEGGNNDKALNNAAVAFENVKRFQAATKVYERIVTEYPNSTFVDDALFRTAANYARFFEFDKAVVSYQRLATDSRFKGSAHRTDALFNAANILENDQAYDQAAKLFQTYALEPGIKKEDASDAFFRSGVIFQKNKDATKCIKTFREFLTKYPGDTKKTVEANVHIAECFDMQRDRNSAKQQYEKIGHMAASVTPGSDAAEGPAHALFMEAEAQLPVLEKMKISTNIKDFIQSRKKFEEEIVRMTQLYNKVIPLKRATWLLASYFRIGYVYELLSKNVSAILQAPPPKEILDKQKKLDKAGVTDVSAIDLYTQQIQDQIGPQVEAIDAEVVKRYRTVLDQASKLGVSNDWTKLARQKANAYKPDEFPMLKDEKVLFQMETP